MALHTRSKKPRNRSDGTKPLPEPMLTFQQGGLVTFISAHFTKKAYAVNPKYVFRNHTLEITTTSPRGYLYRNMTPQDHMVVTGFSRMACAWATVWLYAYMNVECLSEGLVGYIHECHVLERGSDWIHTWMSGVWVTLWLDACMNTKCLSDGLIRCIHECQVLKRRPDWMHTGMSSAWATGWLDAYMNVRCLSDGLIVFIHECQVLERRAYWMHTWMSGAFKTVILDAYMNVSCLSAGLIGCIHKWSFL